MINKKYKKMLWVIVSLFVLLGIINGCAKEEEANLTPIEVETDPYTTCFGIVTCIEPYYLNVPFESSITNIWVREGEEIDAGQKLLDINIEENIAQKDEFINKLEKLKFEKEGLEIQLQAIKQCLSERQRVTNEYNELVSKQLKLEQTKLKNRQDEMMLYFYQFGENNEIISDVKGEVINIGASDQRSLKTTNALIEYKNETGIHRKYLLFDCFIEDVLVSEGEQIDLGSPLVRLRDIDVKQQREKFEQDIADIEFKIVELQTLSEENKAEKITSLKSEIKNVEAQIKENDIQQKKIEKSINKIETLNQEGNDESVYWENSNQCFSAKKYIVEKIHYSTKKSIPQEEIILTLLPKDKMVIECYVEEQLIKGMNVGDEAIVSLYSDPTMIEIGEVRFIAQKAELINGETRIRVDIAYEGETFLPGYNVMVKIK